MFFRPFNMALILYEVSFGQKSKIAFIGAKLRFVIVYTSLLDEQAFKSAVFSQWFCLWSILYCYLQWICQVAKMRRSDSQVFFVFPAALCGVSDFHDSITTKANIPTPHHPTPPHATPAYSRLASTSMTTSQRRLTCPPHPTPAYSRLASTSMTTSQRRLTCPPHPTPAYSRLASASMTTSQRRLTSPPHTTPPHPTPHQRILD